MFVVDCQWIGPMKTPKSERFLVRIHNIHEDTHMVNYLFSSTIANIVNSRERETLHAFSNEQRGLGEKDLIS